MLKLVLASLCDGESTLEVGTLLPTIQIIKQDLQSQQLIESIAGKL